MARTHTAELPAYHEAGHVVVGLFLGLDVKAATIRRMRRRGQSWGGYTWLAAPWWYALARHPARPTRLYRTRLYWAACYVAFSWAGCLAEQRMLRSWGKRWPERMLYWGPPGYRSGDYEAARECARIIGVRRPRSYARRFREITETMVEALWPLIETVADRLLKRRRLGERAVWRIETEIIGCSAPRGIKAELTRLGSQGCEASCL